MATFQYAIDNARLTLNDSAKVRYTDPNLFVFAKDCVREIAIYRPDLFMVTGNLATGTGYVRHSVEFCDPPGLYLLDVHNVNGGRAVLKSDFDTVRRFNPNWRQEPQGPAENWWPVAGDQTKRPTKEFYICPPAPAGQVLLVQYVKDPLVGDEAIGDEMPLEDQMVPAVTAYVIYRAESIDDEHVLTQRAAQGYTMFANIVGIAEGKRKTVVIEGRPQ